jgi:hypothetical protein
MILMTNKGMRKEYVCGLVLPRAPPVQDKTRSSGKN